jgi:hypothetical protein
MTNPPIAGRHLWEYEHPLYCEQGNYYKSGLHLRHDSWRQFVDDTEYVTGDRNANLLFRWDWHQDGERNSLDLYFILQRKGLNCSHEITVTVDDETEIRAFLEECAETMRATWEPLLNPSLTEPAKSPALWGEDDFLNHHDGRVQRLASARWRLATRGSHEDWLRLREEDPEAPARDVQAAMSREENQQ